MRKNKRFSFFRGLLKHLDKERKDIVEFQNNAIQNLVQHAYQETSYYKHLFDSLDISPLDIKTQEDLSKIPELTKQIIRDNLDDLKSKDKHGKQLIRTTSGGSTGEQALIYKSNYFNEMSRASWLRNNAMIGWYPTDKSAWFWPSRTAHRTPINRIRARISMFIQRRTFLDAYNYSDETFLKWYRRIQKFEPKVVYGYASIILEFSQFLIHKKLRLPSVQIVVSTAEKLMERETIATAFNCQVHNQYGCSEIIAIGTEISNNHMVLTDDVVVLRTNEENQFLLTGLFSFGFPLINYKVADAGEFSGNGQLHEKYPFPLMNLSIGRMSDYFLRKDNTKVSSTALSGHISTLPLGIRQHQIKQNGYTEFVVSFVPSINTKRLQYEDIMTTSLYKYFGESLTITFKEVEQIPKEISGKRLLFKRTFNLEL